MDEEPGRPQPIAAQSWTQLSDEHFFGGDSAAHCCLRTTGVEEHSDSGKGWLGVL